MALRSDAVGQPAVSRPRWWRLVGRGRSTADEDGLVEHDEVAGGDQDGATGLETRHAALAVVQRHLNEGLPRTQAANARALETRASVGLGGGATARERFGHGQRERHRPAGGGDHGPGPRWRARPRAGVLQLRVHASVPVDVLHDEAHWLKERGFELALAETGGASSGPAAFAAGGFNLLKFATNLLADAQKDDGAAGMLEALCAFAAGRGSTSSPPGSRRHACGPVGGAGPAPGRRTSHRAGRRVPSPATDGGGWQRVTGSSYGVIFDLDGVLTDTAEFHYLAWQALADGEGIPFDREANERLRGVSRRDSLLLLLGDREVDETSLEAMMERKNDLYLRSLQDMSPQDTLPGAIPLVLDAKRRGMRVAIGSSSKNARFVLDKLGIAGLFDAVADGTSVDEAKPAPDLFLHAAALFDLPPARCVVVEDAASGVDAALAAGMVAVGVGPQERVGHAHHRWPSTAEVDLDAVVPLDTVEVPGHGRIGDGWVVMDGPDLPARLTSTDGGWRADIGVPAALPTTWAADDAASSSDGGARQDASAWSSRFDIRDGYHRRRARAADALESFEDAWFVPLEEPYLLVRRQVIAAPPGTRVRGHVGIDLAAWVGRRAQSIDVVGEEDGGWDVEVTVAGRRVTLAARVRVEGGRLTDERHDADMQTAPHRVVVEVGDDGRAVVAWFLAVEVRDAAPGGEVAGAASSVRDVVRDAASTGSEPLLARNALSWEEVWRSGGVEGPDPAALAMARQARAHAVVAAAADGWPSIRGAAAILDRLGRGAS